MENSEYGYVKIRLNELIKEKKVSKNKLATKAQMQRTQLNNYCKEKMQRVDLAIIARICYCLLYTSLKNGTPAYPVFDRKIILVGRLVPFILCQR